MDVFNGKLAGLQIMVAALLARIAQAEGPESVARMKSDLLSQIDAITFNPPGMREHSIQTVIETFGLVGPLP